MSSDLYAAWLTAGDRLQSIGAWLAGDGAWLPIFTVAAAVLWAVCWALRGDDYRTRNDQAAAERLLHTNPPQHETAPGSNEDALHTCRQIMRATDSTRKEKP